MDKPKYSHEVFADDVDDRSSADVFREIKPLPQEVLDEQFEQGALGKEEFIALKHNWYILENIRTGLGIGNNQPFLIDGSVSGKFIPNYYDDVAYELLRKDWNFKLLAAPSGKGKSVLSASHAFQVNAFYGMACLRADRKPPHEDSFRRYPNFDPVGLDRLRRWNLLPVGLNDRLLLLQAPNVGVQGAEEVKVDLKFLWESLEVDEELEDAYYKLFKILWEIEDQQKANYWLNEIMMRKPNTFNDLEYFLSGRMAAFAKMKDDYFMGRVKRSKRMIIEKAAVRVDLMPFLLRRWPCSIGGRKELKPFVSLATDLFQGNKKHSFCEYYLHSLFYFALRKKMLNGVWDVNDEVDVTRNFPLLRELCFWKAQKLRSCGYSSENATQDVSLFTDTMRDAAQTFLFTGSTNIKFALGFCDGMSENARVVANFLREGEWCFLNKQFDQAVVFRAALPSLCGYPIATNRLIA